LAVLKVGFYQGSAASLKLSERPLSPRRNAKQNSPALGFKQAERIALRTNFGRHSSSSRHPAIYSSQPIAQTRGTSIA